MSYQKQKGTSFEVQVAAYMDVRLWADVERRALAGVNDKGDIAGIHVESYPVVVECKNHQKLEFSTWLDEARKEADNAHTPYGFVVAKRRGCGVENFGKNYAVMELDTLTGLLHRIEGLARCSTTTSSTD